MKKSLLLMLMFTALFLNAAGTKIGVINLEKIFQEYYKSKIAEEFISQQAAAARTYLAQLRSQLETLQSKSRTAATNALNPAITGAAKEKLLQEAEDAKKVVLEKEREMKVYMQEQGVSLRKLEEERRAEIVKDIQDAVRRRAELGGYTLILDSSGKTMNNVPTVLYARPSDDLTKDIIRELNRGSSIRKNTSTESVTK